MGNTTPHTSTYQGKRVSIKLLNGEIVVGKFHHKKGKYIYLTEPKTKLNIMDIRNLIIKRK